MRPIFATKAATGQRDSFDDRICSDLCELILSFLPIEDKARLECLSKHIKESMYEKQYRIDCQLLVQYLKKDRLNDFNGNYCATPDWKLLARFLSKCPNVMAVDIPCLPITGEHYDQLLNVFTDNCPKLRQLTMLVFARSRKESLIHTKKRIAISPNTIKKFIEKFKDQLELIDTNGIIEKSSSYCMLKNLKCFHLSNHLLKPTNLNKLVYFYLSKNNIIFDAILESNRSNLKTLHLVNLHRSELNKWESINHSRSVSLGPVLASVPQLKNLVNLSIEFNSNEYFGNTIITQIMEIGLKCQRLKSLKISVIGVKGAKAFSNLFNLISPFKNLKNFKFLSDRFSCDLLPVSSLSRPVLKQLTNLYIGCNQSNQYVYDSFFNDIDQLLPNLQSLHLSNVRLNDSTLISLSKMRRLVSVCLTPSNAYYDWPQLFVMSEIFVKCTKLLSFSIYYYTFNSSAIDSLRAAPDKVSFEDTLLNICPQMKNFFWLIEGDDRMFNDSHIK